jgi:hypothetical protein
MKHLLNFLFAAALASSALAQWQLGMPIKTRSKFQGIQMVYNVVGHTIDLHPYSTKA